MITISDANAQKIAAMLRRVVPHGEHEAAEIFGLVQALEQQAETPVIHRPTPGFLSVP